MRKLLLRPSSFGEHGYKLREYLKLSPSVCQILQPVELVAFLGAGEAGSCNQGTFRLSEHA